MVSPVALKLSDLSPCIPFRVPATCSPFFYGVPNVFCIYSNPLCFVSSVADFSGLVGAISNIPYKPTFSPLQGQTSGSRKAYYVSVIPPLPLVRYL